MLGTYPFGISREFHELLVSDRRAIDVKEMEENLSYVVAMRPVQGEAGPHAAANLTNG
ncbi:MAG: hypothetical protein P4M15_03490 [Alphaproteobacteria bacterium]|nr:hypothetical protein [Alphaproteobacteria bacterium]